MNTEMRKNNNYSTKMIMAFCLIIFSTCAESRTYQSVDVREGGKMPNDDISFNNILRQLQEKKENNEGSNGVHEVEVALNKLMKEFKQLQKDLEYCKSVIPTEESSSRVQASEPNKDSSSSYIIKDKPSRKHPYDSNVNDVVSDEDDKDSMRIDERNYYGWMDFGK